MNSRLESLVKRGYSIEEVNKLSSYSEEDLNYACNAAFMRISHGCVKTSNPIAIYVGGQPGCGKTIMSMNLKNKLKNAMEIGIDNYRMYHPNYLEIEKCIRKHWKNREETINDSPGNDIADFTHEFAGVMTDKLIELGKNNKFNMILEWGMREPTSPLKCMDELKKNSYNNIVSFVLTSRDLSYEACNIRAEVMKNSPHIIRKVPKYFHDYSVDTLPNSIETIYKEGFSKKIVDFMILINRDGKVLWNNNDILSPRVVFNKYVNNSKYLNKNSNNLAFETSSRELTELYNNNLRKIS